MKDFGDFKEVWNSFTKLPNSEFIINSIDQFVEHQSKAENNKLFLAGPDAQKQDTNDVMTLKRRGDFIQLFMYEQFKQHFNEG